MTEPVFLLDELMHLIERYMMPDDIERVHEAFKLADLAHQNVTRKSGELYITHPLSVAIILAGMRVDAETVMAALLHDVVEDTPYTVEDIERLVNADVARLVDGVTKLDKNDFESKQDAIIASFRKMMDYFADDYRVVLVKLADRLHNLRTLEHQSAANRRRIAKETMMIYVPLAQRMGLNVIRREMELLAFRNMYPWRAQVLQESIDSYLATHKDQQEQILKAINTVLQEPIPSTNVFVWEKNLYKVYERIKKEDMHLREQRQLLEIRIVVGTVEECYRALGLIHSIFRPKEGGFRDLIGAPDETYGFQSLQTFVHCSSCANSLQTLRIQIQTRDMFHLSQYGIAAAWRHPELSQRGNGKIAEQAIEKWLDQVRELSRMAESPMEFHNFIQNSLFLSEVYAFTPQGHMKEFPAGACLVDFAYAIHTEVGNHCIGAKVNGVEVSLRSKIPNGAIIEILTDPDAWPQLSWLDVVVTPRARSALRTWQRQQTADEWYELGKSLLNSALKRSHVTVDTLDPNQVSHLISALGLVDLRDLLCAIGRREQSAQLIAKRLTNELNANATDDTEEALKIKGSKGLVTKFAPCCYPVPNEEIEAYLDPKQGLVVHRDNCPVLHRTVRHSEIMDVGWAEQDDQTYNVLIKTTAKNVVGVLGQITSTLAKQDVNIEDIHTSGDRYTKETLLLLWVKSIEQVHEVIRLLSHIPGITKVERVTEG